MSKYLSMDDSDSDDSLDGFIEYPKRDRKHKRDHKRKHNHKRKRSDSSSDESVSVSLDSNQDNGSDNESDQDDDFESPVSNLLSELSKYFGVATSDAKKQIVKQIQLNLPQLPSDRTKHLAKTIVQHLDPRYLSTRAGVRPTDKSWRLDLSREEVDSLKPILKRIRAKINSKLPTIPKILKATVPFSNKVAAVQWFDVLQNIEPYTAQWVETKQKINRMIKQDSSITPEQLVQMDAAEERLELITPDHDQEFKDKIYSLQTTDRIKSIILQLYNEMLYLEDNSQERARHKLQLMVNLPYERKISSIPVNPNNDLFREDIAAFLNKARARLDERLYGMDKIKDRIINMLHSRIFSDKSHSILCLKGSPGVGKTALASAVAYASDKPFERISAGGITDPTVFKGSCDVWVGSEPSIIIRSLCRAGVNDPVILIDELDKAGGDHRSNIVQNALFEILDPEQNNAVKDNYLNEFDHDFSHILWVISVNEVDNLHPALRSRLDIIEVEPYTREQLLEITRNYVLPAELKMASLPPGTITINDEAIDNLIRRARPEHSSNENEVDIRIIRNAVRSIVLSLNTMETYRRTPPDAIGVSQTGPTTLKFRIKRPRITYKVKDFNGFPYQINTNTVDKLVLTKNNKTLTYYT